MVTDDDTSLRKKGSREARINGEDASTPLISNRAVVVPDPPPIELPSLLSNVPLRDTALVLKSACFSSPDKEPILMTHLFSNDEGGRVCATSRAPQEYRETTKEIYTPPILPSPETLNHSTSGVIGSSLMLARVAFRLQQYRREKSRPLLPNLFDLTGPFESNDEVAATLPDRHVHGIPNYGQTCFLNAVLQSLASMEPVMVYLERLVEVNQERNEFSDSGRSCLRLERNVGGSISRRSSAFMERSEMSVSAMLLGILRSINGATNGQRIDTLGLLHAIGDKHPQFRAKHSSGRGSVGKEQQDAEELLQALFGIVIDEAQFDLLPSAVPSAFVRSLAITAIDEEVLTLGSSLREKYRKAKANDGVYRHLGQQQNWCSSNSHDSTAHSTTAKVKSPDELTAASTVSAEDDSPTNIQSVQREEKKEEEFEIHVPRVYSEENLACCVPLEQIDTPAPLNDLECLSDISAKEKRLSAAMQIMMTTTSSLSPDPLCAWIGSVLQCRRCKHVRPIQNTPFFNIPVVPTAVSNLLSPRPRTISRPGKPPQKYSPGSAHPPCTLEDCLEEFTAVERVQDVDCRFCTLRREKTDLEEEVSMLGNAIDGLVARARRKQVKRQEDLNDLHCDLLRARAKLVAVNLTSPDDDEPLEKVLYANDLEMAYAEEQKVQVERCDFFKCLLLTRLPSVLAIHVQRRYYDPMTNRMSKTIQHVAFPEFLDVAPYCAYAGGMTPETQWAGTLPKRESSCTRRPIHYRLLSVIEHRGGAFDGHYVCYRRDSPSGRWLFISDDTVKVIDLVNVRCCQAYMIFYEAISSC